MSNGYEGTPPPTTMEELRRQHPTSPYGMYPPPQPEGSFMGRWWRELVAICTGLATVGAIAWVVGKQFFVTREEWNEKTNANQVVLQRIDFQLDEVKRSLQTNNVSIEKVTTTIEEIQRQINAVRRPVRRSE